MSLLKQKPLESKFIDLLVNLKRMAIVNHLVSFRFPDFMQRVNFKFYVTRQLKRFCP